MNDLSYRILKELCSLENETTSHNGNEDPYTNRVQFIIDTILDLNLLKLFKLNVDIFTNFTNTSKYANIELSLYNDKDESVIFMANHDIKNINSENCQDNSSSVANLLAMALNICKNIEQHRDKNIHIVFTDCGHFGNKGAMRLSDRIKSKRFGDVKYVVNLELTGNGGEIWKDGFSFSSLRNGGSLINETLEKYNVINNVETKVNDSYIIRSFGIDCMTIGTLTSEEMVALKYRGSCRSWEIRGTEEDNFENNANAVDMSRFVEFLSKLT